MPMTTEVVQVCLEKTMCGGGIFVSLLCLVRRHSLPIVRIVVPTYLDSSREVVCPSSRLKATACMQVHGRTDKVVVI